MWNNIYNICIYIAAVSMITFFIFLPISIKFEHKKIIENIFLASGIIFFVSYIMSAFFKVLMQPPKQEISVRIENVSTSLTDISNEIEEIQSELTQRVKLVAELKEEAEIAENVISLSDDQVTAIQAKLRQELDSNNGKNFMQGILINGLFFILGIIFPRIIKSFKRKSAKTDMPATTSSNSYSEEEIAQAIELLETIKKDKK